MKKILVLIVPLMAASVGIAGEKRLEWNFSVETSYPKEVKKIKPADLARRILEIQKLNKADPMSKDCDEAIRKYDALLAKYPERPEVYGEIPTCKMGERAFGVIMDMLARADEKAPAAEFYRFGADNMTYLTGFYDKAGAYFAKALNDKPPPEVLEAYLNYDLSRLGMTFINFVMTDVYALFAKKAAKKEIIDNCLARLNQYIYEMASDNNLKVAERLYNADPKNQRYTGMYGSFLVGRVFTDIIAGMVKAAGKNRSKEFDVLGFLQESSRRQEVSGLLDKSIGLLVPVCEAKKYGQACVDLELAKFLKDPKKE